MIKLLVYMCLLGCLCSRSAAQNVVSDTSVYLKDTILAKKQIFIGKAADTLFKQMRLSIVSDANILSKGYSDTFYTKEVYLWFFPTVEMASRMYYNSSQPMLVVTFKDTIAIPRSYFNKGEMLDYYTGWNKYKRNFWGKFIVADIRASGIK
jgi:hypothetical protein